MSDDTQEVTEDVENVDENVDSGTDSDSGDASQDQEVKGNTNDSINSSLEDITDVDVLKGMITRLRHENGNHRKEKQSLKTEVDSLKQWKLNHNKGVSEAQARATKAEQVAKQYVIKAAALEYQVDEDLIDLIDGKTEEEIWAKAEKLANTKKQRRSYEEPTPTNVDLFGGRRGEPVKPPQKNPGGDWLKDFMGGNY